MPFFEDSSESTFQLSSLQILYPSKEFAVNAYSKASCFTQFAKCQYKCYLRCNVIGKVRNNTYKILLNFSCPVLDHLMFVLEEFFLPYSYFSFILFQGNRKHFCTCLQRGSGSCALTLLLGSPKFIQLLVFLTLQT